MEKARLEQKERMAAADFEFEIGDLVQVSDGGLWWDAKIERIRHDSTDGETRYFCHFKGKPKWSNVSPFIVFMINHMVTVTLGKHYYPFGLKKIENIYSIKDVEIVVYYGYFRFAPANCSCQYCSRSVSSSPKSVIVCRDLPSSS